MYLFFLFVNDTATPEIYTYSHTLSLHYALPISAPQGGRPGNISMTRKQLPHIALLGTGGTIASTAQATTAMADYTVTEGIDSLLTAVPEITSLANIQCQQAFNEIGRASCRERVCQYV